MQQQQQQDQPQQKQQQQKQQQQDQEKRTQFLKNVKQIIQKLPVPYLSFYSCDYFLIASVLLVLFSHHRLYLSKNSLGIDALQSHSTNTLFSVVSSTPRKPHNHHHCMSCLASTYAISDLC